MGNNYLSEEEKRILEEMKNNWEKEVNEEKLFWRNVYSKYSVEEKVNYWSQILNQQMRWQVESGLYQYAIFSKEWHKSVKEIEPDIDKIIATAFERFLSWEWSKDEYLERIQR